jgi:hypothetical protein
LAAILVVLAGCGGGGKEPKTLPAQTTSLARPELEAPPPLPPPIRRPLPPPAQTVKVIDAGEDPRPKTLIEASRLAKARKALSPPPVIEVTDENLQFHAQGGKVTVMSSAPAAPALDADPLPSSVEEDAARDEPYWRRRGLSIRRSWRQAIDTIDRLELEAAALRQRFYAEDDPYVRDNRVKPPRDRPLDRISDLREEAAVFEEALGEYLDEGRQEGIPTGWLNDGWELEPSAEELEELEAGIKTQRAIDTPIADDPFGDIDPGGGIP